MLRLIPAGAKGVDFSFARPPAGRLLELGYSFVVGYLSVPPSAPAKNITKAECDAYLAAGLAVLLVWEMSATRATLGAAYGTADGKAAAAQAAARDYPPGVPIIAADDCATTTANLPNKIAYMQSFAANCYPYGMGIYGGVKILAPLAGLWAIGWVPISAWSWSVSLARQPGETDAHYNARGRAAAKAAAHDVGAHVLQDTGFYIDNTWAVDPNEAIAPFPAWAADPQPQPEDDMDVITNAEPYEGEEALHAKFAVMPDGTYRPLSGTELKARGITNSLQLGVPMTNAELAQMGKYEGPFVDIAARDMAGSAVQQIGKIDQELGLLKDDLAAAGHRT